MATSWSVGWLAYDGRTGKWSWKKANRKKAPIEVEGRTKAQRARDRKAQAARRAKTKKARQKRSEDLGQLRTERAEAKARARFDKARAREAFRERAEARPQGPDPKVTVTGVRSVRQDPPPARVVPGEVLGSRTQTAIGPAQRCGQKTADGTACRKLGTCPPGTHKAGPRKSAAKPRQAAGSR